MQRSQPNYHVPQRRIVTSRTPARTIAIVPVARTSRIAMTWAPTEAELRRLHPVPACDTACPAIAPSMWRRIEGAIHSLDSTTWLLIAADASVSKIRCHHSEGAINQALRSDGHERVDVTQGQHAGAITLIVGSGHPTTQANGTALAYFEHQLAPAALARLRGGVLVSLTI